MTPQPERVAQYQNLRNVGSDFKASSTQARCRQDALTRQKEQRKLAFSLARDGLDDILDGLALSESSDDDVEQEDAIPAAEEVEGKDGRFDDAIELPVDTNPDAGSQLDGRPVHADSATAPNKKNKSRRHMPKRIRRKYKAYADRLMQGEALDLEGEGLPPDLAGEWLAVGPVPKGKRCMAVTFASTRTSRQGRVTNTILLARTTGKPLLRQNIPVLPANCVLDCIYVKDAAALFVVDFLQWKGQSVAEGEAEFRMFWRDSMLAELPAQTRPAWTTQQAAKAINTEARSDMMQEDVASPMPRAQHFPRPSHLLVLPIPCLSASPDFPKQLEEELVKPCLVTETAQATLSVIGDPPLSRQLAFHQISYQIDGLSLLVKSAAYESGLTPLAAWVPKTQLHQLAQSLELST